ncbi:hypothetical protein AAHH78_38210, partial [Burkholderia pseudomallei]
MVVPLIRAEVGVILDLDFEKECRHHATVSDNAQRKLHAYLSCNHTIHVNQPLIIHLHLKYKG